MPVFDLKHVTDAVAHTRFAGRIEHFESLDSTSSSAGEAATGGAPDGTVFIADEQKAGRGRGGHTWHSTVGEGLYVSTVLRPRMALSEALWLSLATGLAAQRAIAKTIQLGADLRWPNDLLIGTKKCGGILVETASDPGAPAPLRYAVIGIGINVNHAAFPPELSALATSLRMVSGHKIAREALLANLLLALDQEVNLLEAEIQGHPEAAPLLERFTAASSWVRGKRVCVEEGGGYTGETAGLGQSGFLLVAGDDGVLHTVLSGGVRSA